MGRTMRFGFPLSFPPCTVGRELGTLRLCVLLVTVVGAAFSSMRAGAVPPGGELLERGEVAVFFYTWYGTPALDGAYAHWHQNGHAAPSQIASSYYPARGVYSSSDPRVLRAQLREVAATGADTVVVSWWGHGSIEDVRFDTVVAEARTAALRVALHVEPYRGRTPASVAADIERMRARGVTDFYVYDSTVAPAGDWAAALSALQGVRIFANTALAGTAKKGGFDGLYTYDVYVYDGSSFPRLCKQAWKLGLLCAPSVGPGYDARRATGDARVRSRLRGARYDWMWRKAVHSRADIVTVTSYNEWHEGTQIEPAAAGGAYASYEGAWGLRGRKAESAYLRRTAHWIERYRARLAAP
jgi:glycoprotein endo-alpha-1,2-mannosidase